VPVNSNVMISNHRSGEVYSILQYILEDTDHCQNMSIADTGRFCKILVIPVLQILEDSGHGTQSVPINSNVMISNHRSGEVYSILQYVIKFFGDKR
jgi:hypothetical protein